MANCPYCRRYFRKKQQAIEHIEKYHVDELDAREMDAAQALYYSTHGTLSGKCMCGCGKDTAWNPKTGKPYKLSSDPECRKRMYQLAEKNMQRARGVSVHSLLDDMEHQKAMQQNRPTHGTYKFRDGGSVDYLSSMEKNWLKFCDQIMEFTSNMIIDPPETFEYFDPVTGKTRQYMPDYYLPDYNLIVEIKDKNNQNPAFQKETKYKVPLKDEVMRQQTKYNYIRINGTNYGPFVEILYHIVHDQKDTEPERKSVLVITESACMDPDDTVNRVQETKILDEDTYYMLVAKDKTDHHLVSAGLMRESDAGNWLMGQLSEDGENQLAGADVTVYKYYGDPDFGPIYKTADDLKRLGESVDILQLLTEAGVYFDDGNGISNNRNRMSMFIRMNHNKK